MRKLAPSLLVLAALLLAGPSDGHAQFRGGAHAVHAGKAFGGSTGIGVRGGIQFPLLPLDVMASAGRFFPDCPAAQAGCGLQGLTVDANFRMLFPLVRPYVSGGLAHRRYDPGAGAPQVNSTGVSVGAGVDVRLAALGGFAEARYEFTDAPTGQAIIRLGVLLGLF